MPGRPHWRIACFIASLLLLPAAGCEYHYRATTTLHADGSVDREIYQPSGEGADQGPMAAGWAKIAYTNDKVAGAGDGKRRYFVASGHFTSADRVPEHFVTGLGEAERDLPPDLPP